MKIGILTYHSIYNFGANLQAFSTVKYLENNGHEAIIINWVPIELEEGYKKGNPADQASAHTNFVTKNLPQTPILRTTQDVADAIESNNIEAVIIGSDAVLQHKNFFSRVRISKRGIRVMPKRSNVIFPNPFWGSFIPLLSKKIPVVAMSASSQNVNYKRIGSFTKSKIRKALSEFKLITARDKWTQDMIKNITKGDTVPEITPDPVFSFNQNIKEQPSKEEILDRFSLPEKYALFSFKNNGRVDEGWLSSCKAILEKEGITPVLLTMPGGIIFKNSTLKEIAPPLDPLDWYSLIKYSSGYIGENMHPIVVALHNAVPFYCFDSYGIVKLKYYVNEGSSKIFHILEQGGFLEHRFSTLSKNYAPPTPEKVLETINNFDQTKCQDFSKNQQDRYNQMMSKILTSFES